MSFTRIERRKLAETVASQLLRELRADRLKPGQRLPSERQLMETFRIGRSTVREAINGLAMIGVLEIRHGQGAFVAEHPPDASPPNAIATALGRGVTRDLFEARRVVEPHVARIAAERHTELDVREMEQALIDHESAIVHATSGVEPAVRFHVAIGQAAHSDVLSSFVSSFAELMTRRGVLLESESGYREREIDEHRSVFAAIRDRDPVLAEQRMRAHLDAVIARHAPLGLRGTLAT
jgi:GntR family transcriptional repressor for pyruvate dehydrogenase complex